MGGSFDRDPVAEFIAEKRAYLRRLEAWLRSQDAHLDPEEAREIPPAPVRPGDA